MDNNPEGTPNPLNPAPGSASTANQPETGEDMATGTGTDYVEVENVTENATEPVNGTEAEAPENKAPASFAEIAGSAEPAEETLVTVESVDVSEPADAGPAVSSSMPDIKPAKPTVKPSRNVVDPMMRPVSHDEAPASKNNNFDTLEMDETTVEELRKDMVVPGTPMNAGPELVAKDSIVDGKGKGGKKKALIIGAIVLLMIAIICGAAAIAIIMNSKGGDRVTKAIDKLLNGEMPNIVSVNGNINTVNEAETPTIGDVSISFNGAFDTISLAQTVSAEIGFNETSINLDEVRNKDGNVFFKLSGLENLFAAPSLTTNEADPNGGAATVDVTDCVGTAEGTDCSSSTVVTPATTTGLLSMYSGLFDAVNDEWILASGDFTEAMGSTELFDNSSTCLINALGTLPQYGEDFVNKYRANQFITYSTDKLEISKKKNELYRLGFDTDKLTEFVNSLSNNGFINELNACAGQTATNVDAVKDAVAEIFSDFPTVYVEIDDNYNFTRVYFKANTNNFGESMVVTADLGLSYPAKIEIVEPEEYVDMSTLLTGVMTQLLNTNN